MAGSRTLKLSILADIDNLQKNLNAGSNEVEGFSGKLDKFGKLAGAAFAAAGAAAIAYAGILLKDGVESAIADAQAQEKLATTLKNVTGATDAQIAATEDWISQQGILFGVTDEELRPAIERMTRATGDLQTAQDLTRLAMDISAGTGKSLEAVTNALGKAYEGNTGSLGRLGLGIDAATLKTMSFDDVTKTLSDTFGGQATAQAETFAGKMDRLKVAIDEGKETVGAYVLDAITPMISAFVEKVIPSISKTASKLSQDLKPAFESLKSIIKALQPILELLGDLFTTVVVPALNITLNVINKVISAVSSMVSGISSAIKKIADFTSAVANSAVGKAVGGILDAILPGRAAGGPVTGGSPYIVGEKGPELFVPNTSGRIVPNNALTGGSQIFNITVNGAIDSEGTARTIYNLLRNSAARGNDYSTLGMAPLAV